MFSGFSKRKYSIKGNLQQVQEARTLIVDSMALVQQEQDMIQGQRNLDAMSLQPQGIQPKPPVFASLQPPPQEQDVSTLWSSAWVHYGHQHVYIIVEL